jgi:iron(III) transport system substrate-binding protein
VAVIGPPVASLREATLKFEEEFPEIRLEYTGMAPAQFEQRIGRERQAGQFLWDAIVSGISSTVFTQQIPAGWYEPIKPAIARPELLEDSKWLGGFDAGFLDNGKRYAYAFLFYLTGSVFVHRDLAPEAQLKKVEDLLDPRWKSKIVWDDPRLRGSGSFTFALLRKILGDGAMKRLLVDQAPVFTDNPRQIAEWLVRGRYPIAIGVSTSELKRFQGEGLGANIQRLQSPLEAATAGWGGLLSMNRAPHPNAARVFINWLLGQRAQSAWANLGATNSRRLDVAPGDPDSLPDPKRFQSQLSFNREDLAEYRAESMKLAQGFLK